MRHGHRRGARPLWSALPEGALQGQLLGELASKANLPLDDLRTLWKTGGTRAPGARGDAPPADHDRPDVDDGGAERGGYAKGQVLASEAAEQPQAVLEKPFRLQQLQKALEQVLGGGPRPAA